jgi:hypothetical protein
MHWDVDGPFDDEAEWAVSEVVGEIRRRLLASIAVVAGGAVFVMLYLGFVAVHFAWYTNLAVALSALVVVPAVVVGLWVHWGLGVAQRVAHHFGGPS